MPTIKCRQCKTAFHIKPFWIKRGFGIYCSAKCHHASQKTGKVVKCSVCDKEVYKAQKALKGSKSKKYFCGKSCQTRWRNTEFSGAKHANYKAGYYTYRTILKRHKVQEICTLCMTEDKRVLAAHHIDFNHYNNAISNLTWLCYNCHFLVHHDNVERQRLALLV